jgi:translocator protein
MKKRQVKKQRKIKKKFRTDVFITSLLLVIITAFLGNLFTDIGPWYDSIKPSITPPKILFPIAWTTLFVLIALSIYFSWTHLKEKQKASVATLYGVNLILNVLWSAIFFGMKEPGIALLEVVVLWCTILLLMIKNWKISKAATWLLLPYLLWVSFATLLNVLIVFG